MSDDLEPRRYTWFAAELAVLAQVLADARQGALRRGGDAYRTIVEIGARTGEVTEWLAQRRDHRRLVVIDPWDGTQDSAGDAVYQQFMARMARYCQPVAYGTTGVVTPPVEVWRQRSQDATPPNDLGVVIHDGDHRDLSDLPRWWDALLPGGILVVHDYHGGAGWPAVTAACQALGPPWHEYRYQPTAAERLDYGPSDRGLFIKVKV